MKYDWLTFDCYGTLIDWEGGIAGAFEKAARTSGIPFDRNRVLSLYNRYETMEEFTYKKYRDVLDRVTRKICMELGYRTADYSFLAESLPRWRPFADTNPVLQRLSKDFKLGILSNTDKDLLTITRRHFTAPFELIITAEDVKAYKPAPNHFQEAKKRIGTAKWLHVAQSYFHDITPCCRVGIDCVWINRKQEPARDATIKPIHESRDLLGFANWIQNVDSGVFLRPNLA